MVRIYVEGGGDQPSLKTECRRAFSKLFEKAGFENRMPSVIAAGSRNAAFIEFKKAHGDSDAGTFVMLLVDSEEPVVTDDPWAHLWKRDGWKKPAGAMADQVHLMVVCMETWLIADPNAFAAYFGRDCNKAKLPSGDLEKRSKANVYGAIAAATAKANPKGKYGKARDSFKLLQMIDLKKLRKSCDWANRFFGVLEKHCKI